MFVTKPSFPQNIDKCAVFPSHENTYYEFKRNLQTFETLSKAICGMLNRKGGYIIFGIDDETHKICGVANTPKLIDDFALYIDRLVGSKVIITDNNQPLHPENAIIELMPHPAGLLVVLNITPLEGVQYKMRDGAVYVRLNASTWNLKKEEQLFRSNDVEQLITSRTSDLNRWKRRAQQQLMKLNAEYENLETNAHSIQQILFQKILQEKRHAERELACKASIWCSILSCF
jgi:predicted HTH transcriptional regulator